MTHSEAQDGFDRLPPENDAPKASALPPGPDIPSRRYDATLRLIRSRLADEQRGKPKPWWKLNR